MQMKDRNGIEIKVGDTVEWIAVSGGFENLREGKVVELVPKGYAAKTPNIALNKRSDRVAVLCERVHSRGTKREYLSPVISRVTVVTVVPARDAA